MKEDQEPGRWRGVHGCSGVTDSTQCSFRRHVAQSNPGCCVRGGLQSKLVWMVTKPEIPMTTIHDCSVGLCTLRKGRDETQLVLGLPTNMERITLRDDSADGLPGLHYHVCENRIWT